MIVEQTRSTMPQLEYKSVLSVANRATKCESRVLQPLPPSLVGVTGRVPQLRAACTATGPIRWKECTTRSGRDGGAVLLRS
jgi:hypothetical protein